MREKKQRKEESRKRKIDDGEVGEPVRDLIASESAKEEASRRKLEIEDKEEMRKRKLERETIKELERFEKIAKERGEDFLKRKAEGEPEIHGGASSSKDQMVQDDSKDRKRKFEEEF